MSLYFYRILFSSLCFIVFGAALAFRQAYLFMLAMLFGALALSAKRKMWDDPIWAELYMEKFDEFWERLIKHYHPDAEEQLVKAEEEMEKMMREREEERRAEKEQKERKEK